jgi:hypothetical protein
VSIPIIEYPLDSPSFKANSNFVDVTKETRDAPFTYISFPFTVSSPFPLPKDNEVNVTLETSTLVKSKYIPPPNLFPCAAHVSTVNPLNVNELVPVLVMCNPPPFPVVHFPPSILHPVLNSRLLNEFARINPPPAFPELHPFLIVVPENVPVPPLITINDAPIAPPDNPPIKHVVTSNVPEEREIRDTVCEDTGIRERDVRVSFFVLIEKRRVEVVEGLILVSAVSDFPIETSLELTVISSSLY